MKTLITNLAVAGTIALLLIVACTREIPVEVPATVVVTVETENRVLVPVMTKVPVTVEVPVEVTREVTVEKRIPVKHEVEVTREVPVEVTREVHVEKRVLVTYEVEVDREVPVTVEVIATREVPATVEVTREVEVPATVEVTREVPIEVTRIVEVTREVPATVEVTREVPVEVTRIVEVTREVEVPVEVTRTVEATREVKVTPTATASLGGGEGIPDWTPPLDPPNPLMWATHEGVWCADNPTERIEWDKGSSTDQMWVAQWPCRIDLRSERYTAEIRCDRWGGTSGYRAFSEIYIDHVTEGGYWGEQKRHHVGYFRSIEMEYPHHIKRPQTYVGTVLKSSHRLRVGRMSSLGCKEFRYIFGAS